MRTYNLHMHTRTHNLHTHMQICTYKRVNVNPHMHTYACTARARTAATRLDSHVRVSIIVLAVNEVVLKIKNMEGRGFCSSAASLDDTC
jgi:hypothetical protein